MRIKAELYDENEVRDFPAEKIGMIAFFGGKPLEAWIEINTGGIFDEFLPPEFNETVEGIVEAFLRQFGRVLLDGFEADMVARYSKQQDPSLEISVTGGMKSIEDGINTMRENLNVHKQSLREAG